MRTREQIIEEARKYLPVFYIRYGTTLAALGLHEILEGGADPLILSIAKWLFIANSFSEKGVCRCGGYDTCALCIRHYYNGNCHGCPVAITNSYCERTPFMDFYINPSMINARNELNFLIGVAMRIDKLSVDVGGSS